MASYEEKEIKLLGQIGDELDKLDDTLGKLDDTDSKTKQFFEQEKALHEIKKIIRKENKLDENEEDAAEEAAADTEDWIDDQASRVGQINDELDKLDTTLGNMSDDDGKVKSYFEQKKAIHEIKKIVKHTDELGE